MKKKQLRAIAEANLELANAWYVYAGELEAQRVALIDQKNELEEENHALCLNVERLRSEIARMKAGV